MAGPRMDMERYPVAGIAAMIGGPAAARRRALTREGSVA